jgi:hypothetical protein
MLHVLLPQSIRPSLPVTVPVPLPDMEIFKSSSGVRIFFLQHFCHSLVTHKKTDKKHGRTLYVILPALVS